MKKPLFTGVCTALVTPFEGGRVSIPMLEQLLARQLEAGVRSVVICGTTGEAPTLSDDEKLLLFRHAKAFGGDELQVLAGTGSNDTRHAVFLSRAAEEMGADGLLVVTPYYNKTTPEGLYAHYSAIASAVHIPVVAYNVPSRTGVDIPVSVYARLAQLPGIVGVKEASPDVTKAGRILAACSRDFCLWSGNDDMAVPMMALGGLGVISVVSNVVPAETAAMCRAALDGDFDTAADLHTRLLPLMEAMFREVNPIPVKAAMGMLGYDCGPCRLPLTAPSPETLARLRELVKS